jgi:thiol-disulfide isomerase/thioredoxin
MKKLSLFLSFILATTFAFAQGKVSFQADIANRNGDVIYIKDNANKTIKEIKAASNGSFKDTFEIKDGFYILFDGVEYAQLYLKDGFDLKLTMDAKLFDESILFKGNGEAENNFLAQNSISIENFESSNNDKNPDDYLLALKAKKENDFDALEKENFDLVFKTQVKKNMTQDFFAIQMAYKESRIKKGITGKASKSFDYENHAGGKTKLEDLRGKYVYIDVWATWCGPCRAELPSLKKIEEKYEGKNIAFVSISVDEMKDHEKWIKFVKSKNLGGIQLIADNNWMSEFIRSFGINSIPRFILIDPTGNVVNADAPRPSDNELKDVLDKLLN